MQAHRTLRGPAVRARGPQGAPRPSFAPALGFETGGAKGQGPLGVKGGPGGLLAVSPLHHPLPPHVSMLQDAHPNIEIPCSSRAASILSGFRNACGCSSDLLLSRRLPHSSAARVPPLLSSGADYGLFSAMAVIVSVNLSRLCRHSPLWS